MTGAQPPGRTQDRETGATFQPRFLGVQPTLSSGVFCLATGVRFDQQELAGADPEDVDPDATSRDLSRITAVEAVYNRLRANESCVPGRGSLDAPDLELDMYASASSMAAELRDRFQSTAQAIQLDPTDADFSRGGLQPVAFRAQPLVASSRM